MVLIGRGVEEDMGVGGVEMGMAMAMAMAMGGRTRG